MLNSCLQRCKQILSNSESASVETTISAIKSFLLSRLDGLINSYRHCYLSIKSKSHHVILVLILIAHKLCGRKKKSEKRPQRSIVRSGLLCRSWRGGERTQTTWAQITQPKECLFDVAALNDARNLMSNHAEFRYHHRGPHDFVKHRKSYSVITVTPHA